MQRGVDMKAILAAAVLSALLAAPPALASPSTLARSHARQVEAVAALGRAQLACFAAHVKRRHLPDPPDPAACIASRGDRFLARYARAADRLPAIGLQSVLPATGDGFLDQVAGFTEGVVDELFAGSDPLDPEQNAILARTLALAGRFFAATLKAHAKDARRPDAAALALARERARSSFLSGAEGLLAKGRDVSASALDEVVVQVEAAESPFSAAEWYVFEGSTSWSGCAEPALNGEHWFTGVSVLTTPAPGVFEGSYEAVSGTFRETGFLLDGSGTLAAGEFGTVYNDFYAGSFFSAGSGECTSVSDPDAPGVYQVQCSATDSLGLACAVKDIAATVRR
jgi:hypothetical protein